MSAAAGPSREPAGPISAVPAAGALPFPDLTGLRASAKDRVTKPTTVAATRSVDIRLSDLQATAGRLSPDGRCSAEDVVALAWTIVLILLLAHENDCHIAFEWSRNRDVNSTVSFVVDTTRQAEINLETVLQVIQHPVPSSSANEEKPQVLLLTCLDQGSSKTQSSDDTLPEGAFVELSISADSKDAELVLSLRASSRIHTSESAAFLLEQFAACLSTTVNDDLLSDPALSRHRFEPAHAAGDNPRPDALRKDIGDGGLEKERFEDQMLRVAQRRPDNVALDFREDAKASAGDAKAGNVLLTYKELVHMASVIATELQRHDAEGERGVVALCLEKSHWTYVAILGVLLAGLTWCPIDTDWPATRREALLAKSKAKVVLAAGNEVYSSLHEVLPKGMQVIRLDKIDMDIRPSSDLSKWRSTASSSDLAYLIWTSGTTGLPKAVGIQHSAAVQALRALQDVIPHDDDEIRYLQFSAYNFDLMILDMFYTWGLGGTLCSSSRSVLLSNLVDIANALQVSHTLLTPAVMAMTPRESIASLKVVINGGEKLSQIVADTWSVDCCLLNLYGPAEATLIAMNRRVPEGDVVKAPNIGVALPTTSCHAVDARNEIVIKGAVGELVIGGHQCAKGYIGDPEKTQDKFIEHAELGRVYKTGDLVRQLWNGDFEYLGRSDDQVKINGIRIELLEINAAVRNAHADVKDSETLLMPVDGGEEGSDSQIVNFSVLPATEGAEKGSLLRSDDVALSTARTLVEQARSNLPTYMVPAVFVIVSHFPKTSSAKIDREALKKGLKEFDVIDWQNRLAGDDSDEEATETDKKLETTIREYVALICRIEASKVGRRTPLPTLGLDSIRAITLARKLNADNIAVSVVDIVQRGTVAAIAETLSKSASSAQSRLTKSRHALNQFDQRLRPAVKSYLREAGAKHHVEKILPATPLQEGLITESTQDESRYWLTRIYALPADIDVHKLRSALVNLVARHEVLRTIFATLSSLGQGKDPSVFGSSIAQIVLDDPVEAFDYLTASSKEEDCGRIAREAQTKFSRSVLGTKPPIAFAFQPGPKARLIMHIHHALYDNIALGYLEQDLSSLYSGLTESKFSSFSSGLPHILPVSIEEADNRLSAWTQLLEQYPKNRSIELPNLSGQEKSDASSQVDLFSHKTQISYNDLCTAAIDMGTSARPLTQSALAGIMARLCETQDIMIGDSISGRAVSSQLDSVVGPVLSTLPIPVHLSSQSTYTDMSKALSQFHQEALPIAHISLGRIRRLLEVPSTSPLFHVVFVFEPPVDDEEIEKSSDKPALLHREGDFGISVEHDLAVEITVAQDRTLKLGLNARRGLITESMAANLLSQYEVVIRQAMMTPEAKMLQIEASLWSPELLSTSSVVAKDEMAKTSQTTILTAFQNSAEKFAKQIAVEFTPSLDEDRKVTLTYLQLERASLSLAVTLAQKVRPRSIIAVTLERSIDTYVALLAIWKAGCCYLPIDVTLPLERKAALVADADASLLLCHNSTRWSDDIEGHRRLPTVVINSLDFDKTPPQTLPASQSHDPAYILYTSGSTGKPKGCCLTHGNLSAAIEAFDRSFQEEAPGSLAEGVRFLARSIESFDVALLEALLPLSVGGTIVTAPRQELLVDLGRAMRVLHVTHAAVVPSLFFRGGKRVTPSDVPTVRALIVGGERVTPEIIEAWAGSQIPLLNAYGPTEATIGTSIGRLHPNSSTGSIGRAFPGTQYMVLKADENDGELVPTLRGEAGELCIAGLQLGSYLAEDEKKAFTTYQGTRIYRTGDEARMFADDSIQYLGRIGGDTQVKIQGVRIELGEIDGALSHNAKHAQNIVTRLVPHKSWSQERIITFIAPASSTELGEDGIALSHDEEVLNDARYLHRVAKKRLPSRMVPAAIVALQCLPLASISGKIDGKRLIAWLQGCSSEVLETLNGPESSGEVSRELNDIEEIVAAEVKRIVQVDQVLHPSTDLFSIGIDSLSFLSLAGALAKKGFPISVAAMMASPTLEGIASSWSGSSAANDAHAPHWDRDALVQGAEEKLGCKLDTAYPTLPLQTAMVAETISAAEDQGATTLPYINVAEYALPKDMFGSVEALSAHIEDVLASHDIYRVIFVNLGTVMVQAVVKERPRYQLEAIDGEDWGQMAQRDIAQNLESATPLRFSVAMRGRRAHLRLAIHHALYDGISLTMLLEQIAETWNSGNKSQMLEGSESFDNVVHAAAKTSEDERIEYWYSILQDATLTPFPRLTGRQPLESSLLPITLEAASSSSLHSLRQRAKHESVTVAMLVLSSFAHLYGQYVGEEDVTFGLVSSGRDASLSSIHGPCVNTVPFRVKLGGKEHLSKLREDYAAAQRFQHVPVSKLSRRLGVQSPLFNTLFSFLSSPEHTQEGMEEVSGDMLTGFPLAIEVETDEANDKLFFRIVCDPSHIPEAHASLFLQQLDAILDKESHTLSMDALSVQNLDTSKHEIRHLVDLFKGHVSNWPDDIAFVYSTSFEEEPSVVTYGQLDEQSDRIADHLSQTSGSVIGVHLRQCRQIYPLLVGLWKAGKTYLPLDPSLPMDRLQYITEVAEPAQLVTMPDHLDSAKALDCPVVLFDDLFRDGEATHPNHKNVSPQLDIPAYIMFTSGSTGKPKGVQVSHRALGAAITSWSQMLPYKPRKSRLLQLASPGFDVFLIEVCMPLALGFSFASAPKEVLLDDLEATFHKLQLTMADLPAALATTVEPERLPPLEWLMSGGDQIDRRTVQQWSSTGLVNAWGPTEATIGNTLGFVTTDSSSNWIGQPYPTSSIFVLDPANHAIVPRGCTGELCVGGPQIADGYVKNRKLTEERFIEVTIPSTDDRVRVYCTGDQGRLLADGGVEILGRIEGDGQVKINSQRVELKEIELAIVQGEGVLDAAVLYVDHPELPSKQLISFIIPSEADSTTEVFAECIRHDSKAKSLASSITSQLSQALPSYMVPQHLLVLTKKGLPLTPNDKKDARALKGFFTSLTARQLRSTSPNTEEGNEESKKPLNATEKRLRALIARFVDADEIEITRTMSLHRLGIDSISGFRLARLLEDNGFEKVTVRTLLRAPTIAKLAQSIDNIDDAKQSPASSIVAEWQKIATRDIDESRLCLSDSDTVTIFPCTPLQQGLLIEGIASEGKLYVHHHAFDVQTKFVAPVVHAFVEAAKRHDILRTSFHMASDEFIQVVHTEAPLTIVEETVSSADISSRLSAETKRKNFGTESELAKPPVRLLIVRDSEHTVIDLIIHHALYDGETLNILFQEIEAAVTNTESLRPPVQFRQVLPSLIPTQESTEFWASKLVDRRSLVFAQSNGSPHAFVTGRPLSLRIKELTQFSTNNDVSVHIVAIFAFSKLLAHLGRQRDVIFAQLFGLRDGADEAERALGPALNTVLTPVSIRDTESTKKALARLQQENDASRDFRAASLADVQSIVSTRRKGSPLSFDALFDFQRTDSPDEGSPGVLRSYDILEDTNEGDSQYALNIEFVQQGDELSLVATFGRGKFSKSEAEEILSTLDAILSHVVASADQPATTMPSGLEDLSAHQDASKDEKNQVVHSAPNDNTSEGQSRTATSPNELIVAEVVAEMTGMAVQDLNIEAELSRFGLDSIAAIRLASKLRRKGLSAGVVDILQGKTIYAIADRLEKRQEATTGSSEHASDDSGAEHARLCRSAARVLEVDESAIEATLPLLPGQAFELAAAASEEATCAGVFTFLYRLPTAEPCNRKALGQAWTQLQRHFAALRAAFVPLSMSDESASIYQVIRRNEKTEAGKVLVETQVDSTLDALVETFDQKSMQELIPVDVSLRQAPCACGIVKALDGEVLVLRLHHALYDGWSLPLLVKELYKLYRGQATISSDEADRHIEYASDVSKRRASHMEEVRAYWQKEFQSVSPTFVSPTKQTTADSRSFLFFRDALTGIKALETKASSVEGGLAAIVQAAWAAILSRLCGDGERVVFGSYQVGRTSTFDGIESVVSNCMNVVPVIVRRSTEKPTALSLKGDASAIKEQLDSRAQLDEVTSLNDILRFTSAESAPWNTYLNLLWSSSEAQSDAEDDSFVAITDAMTRDSVTEENGKSPDKLSRSDDGRPQWYEMLPNLNTDINIDVQRVQHDDAIHVGVQWRSHIWSAEDVQGIVDELCSLVRLACH